METVNELIYTPKGERDYGTLACWGTNSIGKQMEPCLFQVVPAGTYTYIQYSVLKLYILGNLIQMLSLSSRRKPWGKQANESCVQLPVN
jgi:hypothetical protein